MYKVVVHGSNCVIELQGVIQKLGFYVTRFVEAPTREEAGGRALELVQAELGQKPLLNPPSNHPVLRVEEVDEASGTYWPNTGFSWYRETANGPDEHSS